MVLATVIDAIRAFRTSHPAANKQSIASAVSEQLNLGKHRSVYACNDYAVRFSTANGSSFSNVVLSLSALQPFDERPFIVAVIRPHSTEFMLANTTLLKRISHSSHELRVDNIRGSFLGHDISREYEGISNSPENFDELFSIHQEFSWQDNLERLVEATNSISGRGSRFDAVEPAKSAILRSPSLALSLLNNPAYSRLKIELASIVNNRSEEILRLADIDNVNERGNRIEQLITGGMNEHNLADLIRHVDGVELQLEIKTKLMDRASSPKAYNIDKALAALSSGNTVIAYCFVGIHQSERRVTASTVSIFDHTVLTATRIQFHWAGRNSRGVTQLTGNLGAMFSPDYIEQINLETARGFLEQLIKL